MNSTLTLVTPEKAQALLATAYQGQRPLRPHHVRFLRHLMRTGHWRQGAEIHCARIENERFLVNGQHTLTALVQEHLSSWLTLVEIDVPTMAAIGRLYEAFGGVPKVEICRSRISTSRCFRSSKIFELHRHLHF